MKRLSNFKTYESNNTEYITISDIKDIFIELFDKGFKMKCFEEEMQSVGVYFIEFNLNEGVYGFIDMDHAYGFTDVLGMKNAFDFFNILSESKEVLNSMGYTIGYEMESSYSGQLNISITCHIQHSHSNVDNGESWCE